MEIWRCCFMNIEKQFHIELSKAQGAKYALLPGDPKRVPKIADFLTNAEKIAENREFLTYAGYLEGQRILVTSTGIGGPSAAIALEELNNVGVDTIIRIGTCGAMQTDILPGTVIIPTAAVRAEGTSHEYVPPAFPATADFDVVTALKMSANEKNLVSRIGVVHSKDSFYGQHSPESVPVGNFLSENWNAFIAAGVLASEMECAALFSVAAVRKIRAGAVLHALWNQERKKLGFDDENSFHIDDTIRIAISALRKLIKEV